MHRDFFTEYTFLSLEQLYTNYSVNVNTSYLMFIFFILNKE